MNSNYSDNYLIEQWRMRIVEDARTEWNLNATRPCELLGCKPRIMIWYSCTYMKVLEFGVPGQACRLIEFYLAEKIRQFIKAKPSNDSWIQYRMNLVKRFPVIMAGAILISAQLYHTRPVNATTAYDFLMHNGFADCTINDIGIAEFEIMQMHDFSLPMWSSVQIAELLAYSAGLPMRAINYIRVMVNVADFMRYKINEDLRWTFASNIFGDARVLSLHLAASSVYAAAKHYGYDLPTTLPQLAKITYAPNIYLICLSNLILYYTHNEDLV